MNHSIFSDVATFLYFLCILSASALQVPFSFLCVFAPLRLCVESFVFAFSCVVSALHSLVPAMHLRLLHSGGYTGGFRVTQRFQPSVHAASCVISAVSPVPAACHFSGFYAICVISANNYFPPLN